LGVRGSGEWERGPGGGLLDQDQRESEEGYCKTLIYLSHKIGMDLSLPLPNTKGQGREGTTTVHDD
jgi:hypothetical protein